MHVFERFAINDIWRHMDQVEGGDAQL